MVDLVQASLDIAQSAGVQHVADPGADGVVDVIDGVSVLLGNLHRWDVGSNVNIVEAVRDVRHVRSIVH